MHAVLHLAGIASINHSGGQMTGQAELLISGAQQHSC